MQVAAVVVVVVLSAFCFSAVAADALPEAPVAGAQTQPDGKKPDDKKPETKPETKPSTSSPPLQEAEAALRAGIHKKCIELAQEALATGLLDEDGVARAWWTRGRCHSIDGDKDRAERSYAVAVRVKPTILMPVDDPAFDRVKAEGTAEGTALGLAAAAVVVKGSADDAGFVAVDVAVVDDLALGKTFLLLDSDDREVARAPLERKEDAVGDAWTRLRHRFSGIPVEGLSARLLDKHGNVLRRQQVIVDDAARAALTAAGATPTTTPPATTGANPTRAEATVLSYVGGATALAGIVGASAAGIAFAINTQAAKDNNTVDDELPLFIGFVGGVCAVVVGGVLVVVDQVPAG